MLMKITRGAAIYHTSVGREFPPQPPSGNRGQKTLPLASRGFRLHNGPLPEPSEGPLPWPTNPV